MALTSTAELITCIFSLLGHFAYRPPISGICPNNFLLISRLGTSHGSVSQNGIFPHASQNSLQKSKKLADE